MQVSVVVLTYNMLEEGTKPCIDSILRNSRNDDYELIIVDNASNDGTQEYLKELDKKYEHVSVKLNEDNRGYAGGNNDGIEMCSGEYIILLNNDTLVTENWIENLLDPFKDNPKIGLVGPISNSVGNEQIIQIPYLSENNYEEVAKEYTKKHKLSTWETTRLGFFCVAIKKDVIDLIGGLDEDYGLGMFEDDDFCVRALKAGFKFVVTEGAFVYHKGSLSFSKLSAEKYHQLFEKNKKLFYSKHESEWTLSSIALAYHRKIDQELQLHMLRKGIECDEEIERILTRLEPFYHLLMQINNHEIERERRFRVLNGLQKRQSQNKWIRKFNNLRIEFMSGDSVSRKIYINRVKQFFNDKYFSKFQKESNQSVEVICVSGQAQEVVNENISPEFNVGANNFVFKQLLKAHPVPSIHSNSLLFKQMLKSFAVISRTIPFKKVVVITATIDYGYMKQRPQQIAEAFAEQGYLVIYATKNYTVDDVCLFERIGERVILLNEPCLMHINHLVAKENLILYCMWPNNYPFTEVIQYDKCIYDYMDEMELLEPEGAEIESYHEKMLEVADVITVSATNLIKKIPEQYSKKILEVNNAVSKDFISWFNSTSIAPEISNLKDNSQKIIGYYGAIAEWFDFDMMTLAAKEIDANFVLIGPVFNVEDKLDELVDNHSNVFYFDAKKHEELPSYLKGFDVCIIPFIKNEITTSVSPVKLFEYMVSKKPIVTTNLAECRKYSDVKIAYDKEEFVDILNGIVTKGTSVRVHYDETINRNTWTQRINAITKVCSENE